MLKRKRNPSWRPRISRLYALSMLLTGVANANVVGQDVQTFNPTTSGLDFVTVHSSETLDPGVINFGFYMNQSWNSLPYFQGGPKGRTEYTDSLLGADLNVGVGLLPHWDLGISVPQVLNQEVNGGGYHGQFSDNGNTEIRANTKVQLYGEHDYGFALIGSVNVNRIKDNPFTGKDAGPTYNLELAADGTASNVAIGVNFGYRWRRAGEKLDPSQPIDPLGDQYIASGALSYLFADIDTKLIFEVFGSRPVKHETENSDRLAETAEALLGVKYDFTTHLAGHLGGGTELIHGRGSPDWRVYAGVNYAFGPTFAKPAPAQVTSPPQPAKQADPFAGPPKAKEKIIIHDILFEFDSDNLVIGGADDTLIRLVAYLNTKPVFKRLIIEGHTDSIGSDAYNMDLSRRRASTIRKWLIGRYHLPAAKIEAIGRGKRFPIADNGNYQGRQLNRRVEFTIFRDMPP